MTSSEAEQYEIGQVAWLKVVEVNHLGAFVDWGRDKDLFVPFAEQLQPLRRGGHALFRIYEDNQGRPAGSTRIDRWVKDIASNLRPGQEVSLTIADKTELGFKAVVNHDVYGLLYSNELYQRVRKGQVLVGYIQRVREDGKLDLSLNKPGFSQGKLDTVAEKILAALQSSDGFLALTDKSPPEQIYAEFAVSKKIFKQALGSLYKQRVIALEKTGIRLVE